MSGIDDQMNFELLRDSVETLLKSFEPGRFRVVTEQKQNSGAEEHQTPNNESIQLFFETGEFPDDSSSMQEVQHDTGFQIEFGVSASAKVDLTALDDPDSTDIELAAALASSKSASYVANRAIDALYRMFIQIILDPVNIDNNLGLGKTATGGNFLGNTRIVNFRKNQPIARGKLFVLTASAQLTTDIQESFDGVTPSPPEQDPSKGYIDIQHGFNTNTDPDDADPAITGSTINDAT